MFGKKIGNVLIPVIGLGTYDLSEHKMEKIIYECIKRGVNYIDSANRYNNEEHIGFTIRKLGINRNEIIIGTKLSYNQQISQSICESVDESLRKLRTEYIDLYMIHSTKSGTYCNDWIELQAEQKKGKIRELAVSNFGEEQLQELFLATGTYPVLNQVEVNVVHKPFGLIDFCEKHNITVQASCPLYRMRDEAMGDESVKKMMKKYHKSYTQVVLRWLYQQNIISIPKVSSVYHLIENIDIFDFELSDIDMMELANNKV